jgi:type II secretory ATPase GspE/PulE/Tfp pilus assembly ATPase PilB-like protein
MKRTAVQRGLVTLRSDGCDKVRARLTTADEVLRVTQLDVS